MKLCMYIKQLYATLSLRQVNGGCYIERFIYLFIYLFILLICVAVTDVSHRPFDY